MSEAGRKTLAGARVAVTRPQDGPDALVLELELRGAVAVALPLLQIAPVEDERALQAAARSLRQYDWVVFTSANAVRYLAAALRAVRAPAGTRPARVAAVGDATAAAVVELLGWSVDAVPAHFAGDAVTGAMAAAGPLRDARVLWPRALGARAALPRGLAGAGALLDAPPAYRTVELPGNAHAIARLLEAGELDAITLTSPSAARCLAAAGPRSDTAVFAVIGPVTAAEAARWRLPVHVMPARHTIPALVDALAARMGRAAG
jgi:uroporphyrinogen-III synthase